jgi:hypothetical protein
VLFYDKRLSTTPNPALSSMGTEVVDFSPRLVKERLNDETNETN